MMSLLTEGPLGAVSRLEPHSSQPTTRPTKNPGKHDSTNNPDDSIGQERLIWHNGQTRPGWLYVLPCYTGRFSRMLMHIIRGSSNSIQFLSPSNNQSNSEREPEEDSRTNAVVIASLTSAERPPTPAGGHK